METLIIGGVPKHIDSDNYLYKSKGHYFSTEICTDYYKCIRKDCKGKGAIKNNVFSRSVGHNHPPEIEEVKQIRFRCRLQERVAQEWIPVKEIFKEEAHFMKGSVDFDEYKKIKKILHEIRNKSLPPIPNTILDAGISLNDDMYKERLIYAFHDEKQEFYKACLDCNDKSTVLLFMSPVFEDFARMGAPLRLYMDTSLKKINPQFNNEKAQYVIIHLYIGNNSYPFIHLITNNKSYNTYFTVMSYLTEIIPHINVEVFISNDQDSIEAAYAVFPQATKQLYTVDENEKENRRSSELSNVDLYKQELKNRWNAYYSLWRFIEELKELDYKYVCEFYKLRSKKEPDRQPRRKKEIQIQTFNAEQEDVCCQTSTDSSKKNLTQFSRKAGVPILEYLKEHGKLKQLNTNEEPALKKIKIDSQNIMSPNNDSDYRIFKTKSSTQQPNTTLQEKNSTNNSSAISNDEELKNLHAEAFRAVKLFKSISADADGINKPKSIIINPKLFFNNPKSKIIKIEKITRPNSNSQPKSFEPETVEVSGVPTGATDLANTIVEEFKKTITKTETSDGESEIVNNVAKQKRVIITDVRRINSDGATNVNNVSNIQHSIFGSIENISNSAGSNKKVIITKLRRISAPGSANNNNSSAPESVFGLIEGMPNSTSANSKKKIIITNVRRIDSESQDNVMSNTTDIVQESIFGLDIDHEETDFDHDYTIEKR